MWIIQYLYSEDGTTLWLQYTVRTYASEEEAREIINRSVDMGELCPLRVKEVGE